MFNWYISHICVYVFANMYTSLSLCSQQSVTNAYNTGWYCCLCSMQKISMPCKSKVFYYCDSLRNMEQQRHHNENPRVTSAIEAILRDCKWVEGLFWNYHLNWRFGYTGTPLITTYASGLLEGWKTLLNRVGKQKIGKAEVVLTSSCLNLIICFLTSSTYLKSSVIIVYFTDICPCK